MRSLEITLAAIGVFLSVPLANAQEVASQFRSVFATAEYSGSRVEDLTLKCRLSLTKHTSSTKVAYDFRLARHLAGHEVIDIDLNRLDLIHQRAPLSANATNPTDLALTSSDSTLQFGSEGRSYSSALMNYRISKRKPLGQVLSVYLKIPGVMPGAFEKGIPYKLTTTIWEASGSGKNSTPSANQTLPRSLELPFDTVFSETRTNWEIAHLASFTFSSDLTIRGVAHTLNLSCAE